MVLNILYFFNGLFYQTSEGKDDKIYMRVLIKISIILYTIINLNMVWENRINMF